MMLAALLLAQAAAAPAAPAAAPERFSILADPCTGRDAKDDIVVCARSGAVNRLPLPEERGPPDHGVPSNPKVDGAGALAAEGTPCAASQRGCLVGFGQPLVAAAVKTLVGAVRSVTAKHPDTSKRVPIVLD